MIPGMSEMATAGELLELVRSGQASTRTDLRRITGLSRTAVVARVSALLDAGLLLVGEELASTGGRPPGALVFNHDAGVVLGVAVGRSRSQLAIFDLQGRELAGDTRDHGVGISAQKLMPMLAERLKTMLAEVKVPVLGIGMSLPGVVDPERCVSVDSPVMGGWDGVELAPYFAEVADVPLFLANDADVLAYSEMFGPGEKPRNALVLKASTGLGLGVIADGQILTGAIGAAGEIGHTRLDAAGDLPCRCGSNGCLETIAAGWAMTAKLVASGVPAGHGGGRIGGRLHRDAPELAFDLQLARLGAVHHLAVVRHRRHDLSGHVVDLSLDHGLGLGQYRGRALCCPRRRSPEVGRCLARAIPLRLLDELERRGIDLLA